MGKRVLSTLIFLFFHVTDLSILQDVARDVCVCASHIEDQ